ncbi:MAG: restriction endonuclease subunit S [Candidatus Methylumidiphilus sp.]
MSRLLRQCCILKGGSGFPEQFQGSFDDEIPFVKVSDMSSLGNERYIVVANNYVSQRTAKLLNATVFPARSVIFAKVGAALLLNRRRILEKPTIIDNNMMAAIPTDIDADFLYHFLCSIDLATVVQNGALPSVNQNQIGELQVPDFPVRIQRKIAAILTSIDTAIEKTEMLIEKYQQIKAGLMHDLFTRGVLPNGQLRPPREHSPELYQQTAIGWIPKEWNIQCIDIVLDSIVDGPFGSNLKTEHYVFDPGVRVVRLQNISEYEYNDSDRAYISNRHANFLSRNKVISKDVLIAGLGEERYPVGRACCYPNELPPAINKADCFRARCNSDVMENQFLMLFLNTEMARRQIRRYEQGVTRPRINTGNMKRIKICVPESLEEQSKIIYKFELIQFNIRNQKSNVEKLQNQKLGLMQDLLTGKVPVKVDDPAADSVNA